jgi:hypothetical protein
MTAGGAEAERFLHLLKASEALLSGACVVKPAAGGDESSESKTNETECDEDEH